MQVLASPFHSQNDPQGAKTQPIDQHLDVQGKAAQEQKDKSHLSQLRRTHAQQGPSPRHSRLHSSLLEGNSSFIQIEYLESAR